MFTIIFVIMVKKLRHTYLLILAINLALITAEGCLLNGFISDHFTCLAVDNSGLPCNMDSLNSDATEDEVFVSDLNVFSTTGYNYIYQFPTLVVEFNSHYFTSIWQPPKFS